MIGIGIMKNKYYFFKRLYKGYVVVFLKNGKYKSYGSDRYLLKYVKSGDVSHVIVDSSFNVSVVHVKGGAYYKYLIREFLKKYSK